MITGILFLLILFVLSWIVSAAMIFFASKIMGRRQGFATAMTAALVGSIIYTLVYFFIESGVWSALVGSIAWLFALKKLYRVGWIRAAIIAILVWLINTLASIFLPIIF